jgi:hypothetical protein
MIYEFIILGFFWIEFMLQLVHLLYDFSREPKDKFYHNRKMIFKFLFVMLLSADAGYFYTHLENDPLRFARYIRPCKHIKKILVFILLYSKELRRTFKAMVLASQQII